MRVEYVRLVAAPKTCRGTITDRRIKQGNLELLFHHDERLDQRISGGREVKMEISVKVYPGLPHGMCTTNPEQINADLL